MYRRVCRLDTRVVQRHTWPEWVNFPDWHQTPVGSWLHGCRTSQHPRDSETIVITLIPPSNRFLNVNHSLMASPVPVRCSTCFPYRGCSIVLCKHEYSISYLPEVSRTIFHTVHVGV